MLCNKMETRGGAGLVEDSLLSWMDTWHLRSLGEVGPGSGGQKWGHQHKNRNGIEDAGWDQPGRLWRKEGPGQRWCLRMSEQ